MFATLPPDLVHEVFVRITDMHTLSAAIRTSKRCYEIFQDHPKTILRAVAQNIVGPALAPAARLAHFSVQESERAIDLPQECQFTEPDWAIPPTLIRCFEPHASSIRVFRDFYSQR